MAALAASTIFFRTFISGAFFVVLVIFCVLSISLGALWKAPARNLPGWIVVHVLTSFSAFFHFTITHASGLCQFSHWPNRHTVWLDFSCHGPSSPRSREPPEQYFVDKLNHLIIILLLPSRKLAFSVIKIICLLRGQCNPKQERSELPLAATPSLVIIPEIGRRGEAF